MVDQHMKTLVPHSCFKALKDEEQERDRLIILLKEFHSEYDFLEEGCLQRTKKRERVEYIFRDADEIREKKRIRYKRCACTHEPAYFLSCSPALASMCHYKCTDICVPAYVYQHTLRAGTDGPDIRAMAYFVF
ncbi:Uncharacterized protein HZ326_16686 [Fusarium oxysporum f. sp. albedinis]|nr:Uncharacterized protein HZ326_16686 [Fusarium oxysporum f. sp. albedinis]